MNISWNSEGYKEGFSFVPAYGQDVLSLIRKKGGRALDLGCGNGALTAKLSEMGFDVMGLDASDDMIALARKDYPELEFLSGDACSFSLDEKADLIFSNAVLHWIDPENQDAMLSNVYANLRDGGEFVFHALGELHVGDRRAGKSGQKDPPQAVSDGQPEPFFQRFDDDLRITSFFVFFHRYFRHFNFHHKKFLL